MHIHLLYSGLHRTGFNLVKKKCSPFSPLLVLSLLIGRKEHTKLISGCGLKNVKAEREYTSLIYVDVEGSDLLMPPLKLVFFSPQGVLCLARPLQHLFILTLTPVVKSSQMH